MNTVELSVRSKLMQIVEELQAISAESEKTSEGLSDFANNVGKHTKRQIRETETFLGKMRGMMGNVAKSMGDDFKALFSMAGITEGLKLGNVFRENIKETFELSDTIRKLASVFGVAEDRFVGFQQKLTSGLGEIGLSSEAAVNALKGLSETQVRGEEQLTEYARLAGQLGSIGGQKGQEGQIAKGMAGVLTAQGKSPNDISAVKALSEDLRRVFTATGQIPTQVLSSLESILAQMPQDLRKSISTSGLVKLGVASSVGGPNATKFLEEYLGKSPIARKALDARGFSGVFGKEGLDVGKFRKAAGEVINQFPGDPRMMAQTLGLSEEAAEGFIRLYESLDRVDDAQNKMAQDTRTLTSQYMASMSAAEAFSASLNKLKASLAAPIAYATNFVTTGLQKAFQTSLDDLLKLLPDSLANALGGVKQMLPKALSENLGSTAVVAGGGALAALMAGGGLKGLLSLGKGKATGIAERMAFETVTGAKVQDVYVVNAAEISGTSGSGINAGGFGKLLAGGAGIAGAGFLGFQIGELLNEAMAGTAVDAKITDFAGKLGELWGRITQSVSPTAVVTEVKPNATQTSRQQNAQPPQKVDVKVQVESKNKDLKATATPRRGSAQ